MLLHTFIIELEMWLNCGSFVKQLYIGIIIAVQLTQEYLAAWYGIVWTQFLVYLAFWATDSH